MNAARNLWGQHHPDQAHQFREGGMRDQLNNMPAVQARGDGVSEFTGIFLDPKAMCVSATHPTHRIPAIDHDLCKLLIRSFMSTRTPGVIHDGDIGFLFDGGQPTNRGKLTACFVDEPVMPSPPRRTSSST